MVCWLVSPGYGPIPERFAPPFSIIVRLTRASGFPRGAHGAEKPSGPFGKLPAPLVWEALTQNIVLTPGNVITSFPSHE